MTDGTERFFAFARERQAIYLRRRAALPAPWTSDPILSQYRFTNVFRENDKTTVWFREHARDPMRDKPEILLATVVFRWFNRIATGEAIFRQLSLTGSDTGYPAWDSWEDGSLQFSENLRQAILQYCGTGPYVTGAYIIKTPDGYNKLDGVLQCIRWFMEQEHIVSGSSNLVPHETSRLGWQQVAEDFIKMRDADETHRGTLLGMWEWLRKFPFLGDFMAYEIVTDLRHTALLDRAPDIMTWANPGPGATRGLGRVFAGDKDRYNQHRDKRALIEMMQSLLVSSQDAGYWPQQRTQDSWDDLSGGASDPLWGSVVAPLVYTGQLKPEQVFPRWEMREVEHTLCEFDKNERVRTGEGRPRGRFP